MAVAGHGDGIADDRLARHDHDLLTKVSMKALRSGNSLSFKTQLMPWAQVVMASTSSRTALRWERMDVAPTAESSRRSCRSL